MCISRKEGSILLETLGLAGLGLPLDILIRLQPQHTVLVLLVLVLTHQLGRMIAGMVVPSAAWLGWLIALD